MKIRSGLVPLMSLVPASVLVTACGNTDPVGGSVYLAQASYTVSESAGGVIVSVFRTGPNATEAAVDYSVTAGTATSGDDFSPAGGTLFWEAGDGTPKTFTVAINNDQAIESSETFTVMLSNGHIVDLAQPSSATVTITDDDRVGDSFATSGNSLINFDRAAPGVVVSKLAIAVPAGESVLGIDVRPSSNQLIALTDAAKLYVVDPATGAVTLKSTLAADAADTTSPYSGLAGTNYGVDFNPVPDRLRVVSDTGLNLRINVDTGAVTTDGVINGAASGYAAAAYTNSFSAACRTTLYVIDAATDQLMIQNPPNDGTAVVVGPLGVDASSVNGFDIVTDASGANTAYAALTVNGTPWLYTVNLGTGATTPIAAFGGTSIISGLSFPVSSDARPQSAGDLLGLTESGKLLSFNRAAPAKVCTSTAVAGLGSGEKLLGLDTRPADGQVYALSSAGKVYTLDKTSAAATLKSTLTTALSGSDFGIDFNPVPDRLRVVSDAGQNLRIDVDSGATTVDGALNVAGAARGATAVAYTNSLRGGNAASLTTTTYYIDTANDVLLTSSNPNAGVLTPVGTGLGVDISGVNGFDIDGSNNTALVAINATGSTVTTLNTIDLATGLPSASVGTVGGGERLLGLTPFAPPATATVFAINAAGELVKFSPATPATVTTVGALSGLQGGETVLGLDFRPSTGKLYALTSAGRVYTADPATGALTAASTLVADASDATAPFAGIGTDAAYGLDFNPTGPVAMRVVSNGGQNLRVANPDVGNTFTDTPLAYGAFGVTAAAYTNSFSPAPAATQLFVIDSTNDRLFLQNPPNDGVLKDRGPLGVNADVVNGFDIVGASDAYAVLTVAGVPGLYKIDVTSSFAATRATLLGAVGVTGAVKGLAITPATVAPANPTFYALVGDTLVSFEAATPGVVTTIAVVSGLTPGETVQGMDFRPATGALYGLGSLGTLYTIDTTTGTATLAAALAPDAADVTAPYTGLSGTDFGVDFNPVPDRMRVVSGSGQNLRINVGTGATTTDGTLTRPPQIAAAAYTNSFAASTATQLFVIDANSAGLSLQAPPNDGVLTSVNSFGVNLTDANAIAFDIAGGANGFALASLLTDGATQSSLYRVNLATGQATLVGVIGAAGSSPVKALAIQVK